MCVGPQVVLKINIPVVVSEREKFKLVRIYAVVPKLASYQSFVVAIFIQLLSPLND